jgi:hypothetical protein
VTNIDDIEHEEINSFQRKPTQPDSRDLVELVAKAMWEPTHDGSWDDVEFCVGQDVREIYLADARVAIAVILRSFVDSMVRRRT